MYTVTPELAGLHSDKTAVTFSRKERQPRTHSNMYTFVSSFTYRTMGRDLCQRLNPAKRGFDEFRLFQFTDTRSGLTPHLTVVIYPSKTQGCCS